MAEDIEPQQMARLRKQLLTDKAPSMRQQSYQFVFWRQMGDTLGQPFDSTKIPLSKLYQMRRDPMIAFALHYIKVPLIRANWYIKCEDAQIAAFTDYALRRIYGRLVLQYMLSLDFGYASIVKRFEEHEITATYIDPSDPEREELPIWENGKIKPMLWKSFVALPPEQVEPRWTASGDFNGIRYDTKQDVPLAFPTTTSWERDDAVDVPLQSSLWITNEKDSVFGSPWGYPRIGYAFRYWWSYWYRWALADRHFEKDADPPTLVRYPKDGDDLSYDENNELVDYRDIALGMGEQVRSGSTIAMPSDLVPGGGIDDRTSSIYKWSIEHLQNGGNFEAFDKTFDRLEILKLRSIWVPEQAFLEGSGGTSSRNVAATMTDSFQESQAVLMSEFDEHINRFVIPQLIAINFPNFKGEVTKVTKGFGAEDLALAKEIIQWVGQKTPDALQVDLRKLLEQFGMPLKHPDVIAAEEEKAIQQAMALQPPTVPAGPGQAATEPTATDTGFAMKYVQGREVIHLSDDFLLDLPDTPHYKDQEVRALTQQTRELWRGTFAEAYEDFAAYLAGVESFAEGDDDDRLRGWKYNFDRVVDKTISNLKKIMTRAGTLELRKARRSTESWNPNDAAAEWASRHGAKLVQGVSETVKNELRAFLSNEIKAGYSNAEIADHIRVHFAEFPDWKADRLARTETMFAYNFATLIAGDSAGITRVQAIDAQRGPTDEECERRNGKIFTIPDALEATASEHPNATLAWRLLRQTNLSVEKVPRSEIGNDRLAWYDPISDKIYMAEDIEPEQEESYLCMIGERLCDE